MKHGPFIFLGLLLALSLSWLGMVATPQLQLGNQQPTNMATLNITYPIPHAGLANVGLEVYRANGCAYCHTQVIRQEGARFSLVLSNPGTNQTAVAEALLRFKRSLQPDEVQNLLASVPVTVLTDSVKSVADTAQKALSEAGAEAAVRVVPTGPDIERGWGARLSVAHDYLYDSPVLLGSTRLGPDLTNLGARRPDPIWHLLHLFNPKLEVPGSTMPRYPFLFNKRKVAAGQQRSSEALPIPGDQEIVPTGEARALVAYLTSLRVEMPLFEAPGPQIPVPPSPAGATNQPGPAATTNAPASAAATNLPAANQTAPQ